MGVNEIDKFIFEKMEERHLQPSGEASKETLVRRRTSLDAIGLPPAEELATGFLKDSSESAYEKLIDQLLASPHFGEPWASVWMNLAPIMKLFLW